MSFICNVYVEDGAWKELFATFRYGADAFQYAKFISGVDMSGIYSVEVHGSTQARYKAGEALDDA